MTGKAKNAVAAWKLIEALSYIGEAKELFDSESTYGKELNEIYLRLDSLADKAADGLVGDEGEYCE